MTRQLILVALWITSLAVSASAQGFGEFGSKDSNGEVLTLVSAEFEPATVAPGGKSELVLTIEMAPTWHIYSVKDGGDYTPTSVSLETAGFAIEGEIVQPEPHKENKSGQKLHYHEGTFQLRVPVRIAENVSGDQRVKGGLFFTACDPNGCLPPKTENFRAKLSVADASKTPASAASDDVEVLGKEGFLGGIARVVPGTIKPGGEAILELVLDVKPGRWTYSFVDPGQYAQKSVLTFKEGSMVTAIGPTVEPKPTTKQVDFGDGKPFPNYIHKGQFTVRQKIKIADSAPEGRLRVEVAFEYQTCDEEGCLPDEIELKIPVSIGNASPQGGSGGALDNAALDKILSRFDGLDNRIDGIEDAIDDLKPAETAPAAVAPAWEFETPSVESIPELIRGAETGEIVVKFTTPEEARFGAAGNVFVDWVLSEDGKASKRIKEINAVDLRSSEDGLTHEMTLEVVATDTAKRGDEAVDLTISVPLILKSGEEFGFDLPPVEAPLTYGLPNLWDWILKSALAAFLALLTPCVFPMIPVTVSFFTKQAEQAHKNPIVLPFIYVIGIIVSFVVIGVVFTQLFAAAGAQILATNGYIQGFFGLLFVVFSLSLFGVFTLQPPAFLMARAGQVQGRGGIVGTLGMGLLFSLTSFTCTAPLVGLILVAAAESGEWMMPVIGMLAFSAVLAFPFFFLALFPKFLKSMPKSGGWMNSVKVTLGFLELAFALKFIGAMDAYFGWDIFTRDAILWMWVIIFILNGLYLLGIIRFANDSKPDRIGPIAGTIAVLFIIFGVYLIDGAKGAPMPTIVESLMPPASAVEDHGNDTGLGWANHSTYRDKPELAYEKAKELGVPVFIDFTGVT